MTRGELTIFILEFMLTAFECIISSAKAFQPNSGFSESQLALPTGTYGVAVKVQFKINYFTATLSTVSSLA